MVKQQNWRQELLHIASSKIAPQTSNPSSVLTCGSSGGGIMVP